MHFLYWCLPLLLLGNLLVLLVLAFVARAPHATLPIRRSSGGARGEASANEKKKKRCPQW